MNVQRMLADFLSFVTPQNIHKTRMASLCASLQSLVTHGKCTVTAIGRGIQSAATEKSCIKSKRNNNRKRNNNHTFQQDCCSAQYGSSLVKSAGVFAVGSFSNNSLR